MIPRWLKVLAFISGALIVLMHLLGDMSRNTQELYAYGTVLRLERDRDKALAADVPSAAVILHYVDEGQNTKQTPGSYLDRICSLQRTNVIRDIISYLRKKTGEDLGDAPGPWVLKYAPTKPVSAEQSDAHEPPPSAAASTASGSRTLDPNPVPAVGGGR